MANSKSPKNRIKWLWYGLSPELALVYFMIYILLCVPSNIIIISQEQVFVKFRISVLETKWGSEINLYFQWSKAAEMKKNSENQPSSIYVALYNFPNMNCWREICIHCQFFRDRYSRLCITHGFSYSLYSPGVGGKKKRSEPCT